MAEMPPYGFDPATAMQAMLGVSERTLTDWRSKGVGDLRTKALRLVRLCDVVAEVHRLAPATKPLDVLEDGRVPVSGDDEIDSITLLAYVNAYPEEKGWLANVDAAVQDYQRYQQAAAKTRRPVKHV